MSITVTLTEKEILGTPNDYSLGELVRNKYWQERRNMEGPPIDDEQFFLKIGDDGLVKSISKSPWVCAICGQSTSNVEYDYLVGYDHLACVLEDKNSDEKDKCVICGKETIYPKNTHIDMRVGYVEGAGQLCFECNNK